MLIRCVYTGIIQPTFQSQLDISAKRKKFYQKFRCSQKLLISLIATGGLSQGKQGSKNLSLVNAYLYTKFNPLLIAYFNLIDSIIIRCLIMLPLITHQYKAYELTPNERVIALI